MNVLQEDGMSIDVVGRVPLEISWPSDIDLAEEISAYAGFVLGPDAPDVAMRALVPNLPADPQYDDTVSLDVIVTRSDLFQLLAVLTPGVAQVWPPQFGRSKIVVEVLTYDHPMAETALDLISKMKNVADPELTSSRIAGPKP